MKKLQQTFILITCIIVIAVAAAQRDGKIWGEQLSNNKKTTTTNQIDTLRTLDDGTIIINTTYLAKDVKGFGGTVPLNIYIKNGKTTEQALAMKVDGVSGATFSSRGIIGNMKAGLVYASKKAQQPSIFEKMDLRAKSLIGLLVVLMAAIIPLFVKKKRYRIFQLSLNVVVLGLWGGTFISWSVLVGFMSGGINFWISFVPIVMLITAFIYPLFGKKNYYCSNVCPYGAAQELVGMTNHHKWKMSKQLVQNLEHFRKILFWVLMILMLVGVWSKWMDYELFVAFIFQSTSWVVILIAILFLVLAIFIPRPYCRFVCPMGSLFKLSSTSSVKKLI